MSHADPKSVVTLKDHLQELAPGVVISVMVTLAAAFVADRYGAPRMLMALLFGLSLAFLYENTRLRLGIDTVAKTGLKVGVALLGLRIALEPLIALGPVILGITLGCLVTVLVLGWGLGRIFGLGRAGSLIATGAVAICGASAALALTAVTMGEKTKTQHTVTVITGATVLSTIAMVLYPVVLAQLGFSDFQTGVVLGASIHDVAQVVGAGYSVSTEAGDTATLVKLIRVSFLPVLLLLVAAGNGRSAKGVQMPWFVWAFAACVGLRLLLPLPAPLLSGAETVSSSLLAMSVAALGISSSPRLIASGGGPVFGLMAVLTLVLISLAVLAVAVAIPA
ncbi:MAG: putative sulfate exporter family transporter [Rhodobacteraceae bacterium]|nr:putative sulfate exporter family transporter [Paracoccaceae bacterium]